MAAFDRQGPICKIEMSTCAGVLSVILCDQMAAKLLKNSPTLLLSDVVAPPSTIHALGRRLPRLYQAWVFGS
jgi:hypothetical protein